MKNSNLRLIGVVAGLMLAFSTNTWAGANNNQNNSDTINNYGDTNTYNQPQGGTGIGIGVGVGGQGGRGGNATATGGTANAAGGAATVVGSGNSSNTNNLTSTTTNNNTDVNVNDLTNTQGQGQLQGQLQGQQQGQAQSTDNANNADQETNVTVEGDNVNYEARRIPVASAYAPANFPTASCMGSSSGGVQGMAIGLSLGTSWTAEECQILETARNFEEAKHSVDAMHVRCQAKFAKIAPSCKAIAEGTYPDVVAKAPTATAEVEISPYVPASHEIVKQMNFLGAELY